MEDFAAFEDLPEDPSATSDAPPSAQFYVDEEEVHVLIRSMLTVFKTLAVPFQDVQTLMS